MTNQSAKTRYDAFIASIDVSIAGRDQYGDLRWHIECSAEANATGDNQSEEWFGSALESARMCADDWKSFYPQLKL